MGHDSNPTPTDFYRLTGCQRDPRDMGFTKKKRNMCGVRGKVCGWGPNLRRPLFNNDKKKKKKNPSNLGSNSKFNNNLK